MTTSSPELYQRENNSTEKDKVLRNSKKQKLDHQAQKVGQKKATARN